MAVAHESHTLVTGFTSATSIVFTQPAGYSADDILVAKIYVNAAKTITPPATGSWAQPTNANLVCPTDAYQQQIWWKRGDVGGGLTFTWTGSTGKVGSIHRISGCVTSGSPWDGTPSHVATSTASTTSPTVSVTTTVPNTLLFHVRCGFSGNPTWAPSAGFTEVFESADMTADWMLQPSAGGSGSVIGTHGGTDRQVAFLGALAPATAAATIYPPPPRRRVSYRRRHSGIWAPSDADVSLLRAA